MLKNLKKVFVTNKPGAAAASSTGQIAFENEMDQKSENNSSRAVSIFPRENEGQEPPKMFVPERPVTIVIIGAGSRGNAYAKYATYNPYMMKVVGVCDLSDFKCNKMAEEHGIPQEHVFVGDWNEMAKLPKFADAVAICTTDRDHVGPAEAFADLKYHILLEKPMSVSVEECVRIFEAVERNKIILAVCHVLRYTPEFKFIKKVVDSAVLGRIVNIQHIEMVGFWHFAHSYVRGNWHKESTSSFSLLTKCCHDVDILAHLLKQKCKKISSFGNLAHFKKENKPVEAGEAKRCLDCPLQDICAYSAKKLYLDRFKKGPQTQGWPFKVVQPNGPIDIENLSAALQTTNYGLCVYEMENDVCDHQVVAMEFESGSTATLTMTAFSNECVRKTRIFGTAGELESDGSGRTVKVTDFVSRTTKTYDPLFEMIEPGPMQMSGHGGGDFGIVKAFVHACATGDAGHVLTGPLETLDSHLFVFAAEESRRTGKTVDIGEFRRQWLKSS